MDSAGGSSIRRKSTKHSRFDESVNHYDKMVEDDESERRLRRSIVNSHSSITNNESNINAVQWKRKFEMLQQLFIANKITMHNAWNVDVIKLFYELVQKKFFSDQPLQVAASVLEICCKVYGCRLDFLQQLSIQIASNYANAAGDVREDPSDDIAENDDERQMEKAKPKKKKMLRNGRTTVLKPENIKSSICDIQLIEDNKFSIDVDGDPERTRNLLIFTAPIYLTRDHLLDDKYHSYEFKEELNENFNVQPNKNGPDCNSPLNTCVSLLNLNEQVDLDNDNDDDNLTNHDIEPAPVFNDQGQPIFVLDAGITGSFENKFDDDPQQELVENEFNTYVERVCITSFNPEEVIMRSDMNETDSKWNSVIYTGPHYWKNKIIRPSMPRYSGAVEKKVPVKRRKIVKHPVEKIDITTLSRESWKNMEMEQCGRRKIEKNFRFLSRDYIKHDELKNFFGKTFHFDKTFVNAENQPPLDYEHNEYNYDNLEDSQYCGDHNENSNDNLQQLGESRSVSNAVDAQEEEKRDGFLDTCIDDQLMNTSFDKIPYAMKAKKVNVHKIKGELKSMIEKELIMEHKSKSNLCDMFNQLKLTLPAKESTDLSFATTFVSLLYLSSEDNLKLESPEDNENVFVKLSILNIIIM